MFSISKEFGFDAAHRLVHGYKGLCANNHGHFFGVKVFLKSESLNKVGMVRDFKDVKLLKQWVDDNLDHATIVAESDEVFIKWLEDNKQRHLVIRGNPTSENICKMLYQRAHVLGLKEVYAVEVDETCTSKARYEA